MLRVAYIDGDGIGPSIMDSARQIIDASGVKIEWIEARAGDQAHTDLGDPLPQETLATIRDTQLAIKGPCTTPVGAGFRSVNVALRQEFELYANVRPTRAFKGVNCLFPGLDLVTVRENTGGFYTSMEHWIGNKDAAIAIGVNTREGMTRVCRHAFEYAVANGRKMVTAVHKANILKLLSGLFLDVATDMAKEYPNIEFNDRIIDNMAMQLVRDPYQFDVIVSTNLFGDIISDLTAGLIGGLGLAPGANIGDTVAIFEAVHGSAPDIAGKDIANPTSVILAGIMLLRHTGHSKEAQRVEDAVLAVLAEGTHVTKDLNAKAGVGTRAMTEAILTKLGD
ncbi:MAG: isocitrate/isopropylmalate dehydrogenase family protein [Candidatus Eisenbacteria bacterium]|uniref:Isocitrate/isopropylmalate dehydrogenase family protein n=1 Tax=Eiseniibacteriota bacterium TaxID=2212470 RepID=A0A7Y2EB66_UNCEI|nr:isocitrate/isopropylmalate dehydrogenase family protein [Candidatus Eisenbacteria bacterium]